MTTGMDPIPAAAKAVPAAKLTSDQFAQSRLDLLKAAGVDTTKVAVDTKTAASEQWRTVSDALMPGLTAQAQQAGFSHVLDWIEKGAAAKGTLPAPGARTAGAYVTPTEQRAHELEALKATGLDDAAAKLKVHGQARAYATGRIAELRQAAAKLGDKQLTELLADPKADPVPLWGPASKRLSELADAAGYSDPRVFLRTMSGGKAAVAAAPAPAAGAGVEPAPVTAASSPAHTGAAPAVEPAPVTAASSPAHTGA
jgi:hypothetical protein